MSFLGPALPLRRNFETGYKLIDNYKDLVKQNFKNLVLTIPIKLKNICRLLN